MPNMEIGEVAVMEGSVLEVGSNTKSIDVKVDGNKKHIVFPATAPL